MNRISALILVSFLVVGSVFASGVINKIANVEQGTIHDNPAWTGTKYNSLPNVFSGTSIGGNVNYFSQLQITVGDKLEIGNGVVGPVAYVRLIVSGIGRQAIMPVINQYNQWYLNHSTSNVLNQSIVMEDSGWKFNPSVFKYAAIDQYIPTKKSTGAYPLWTVQLYAQMSLDEYNNTFKPAFDAWNAQTGIFVFDKSFKITNNNYSGEHIYYNSARFGSLAADLQNYVR